MVKNAIVGITIAITIAIFIMLLPSTIYLFYDMPGKIKKYGFHTNYIEIRQNIEIASYTENTSYVTTEVWVINLIKHPITLEYSKLKEVVTSYKEIEEEKIKQYNEAKKVEEKLIAILYK